MTSFNYSFCPRHSTKTRTKVWGPVQTSCANVARNSEHTVWRGMNRNGAQLLQVVNTRRASYRSVSNTNFVALRHITRERGVTSGWRCAPLKNAFVWALFYEIGQTWSQVWIRETWSECEQVIWRGTHPFHSKDRTSTRTFPLYKSVNSFTIYRGKNIKY